MNRYDIVGAEDIIGGDMNGYFGGGQLVVGGDESLQQQVAGRNAVLVQQRGPTRARQFPLGFPTTALAAGASAVITTSPQVTFRPRRLVIPSDIAGSILVNDLKVGKNSMFPSANPIPGRMFTEVGVGVDLQLDTAQISQIISLNVTNTSGGAVTFNAGIIGDAIE